MAVSITLFSLSAACFGQATDSNLLGTITDSSGGAVPNATVTAINQATGIRHLSTTDTNGGYRLNNVPVGLYDVWAEAAGFNKATRSVALELNRTIGVNFQLVVGTISTTIDVAEAPANIDTSTAQVQNTFENRAAVELPQASSGLGVINLSLLGAGVASSGGLGLGVGPSVGGQRPTNNSFNIEGIDNNMKIVTGQLFVIPNDAVAQFTLLQNQFGAEFGGASGGIFTTVVKSGTNELHGSAYDYLQNRNLNAVDANLVHQGRLSNPRYDQNRLGATIGGPIIRNKLFYFGNFEYNPYGGSSTPGQTIYAPTTAGYATLAGLSGLSKTNLSVLQQYLNPAPAATSATEVAGIRIPVGPISVVAPNYSNTYNSVVGVDWSIGSRDQFRSRFVYNNYQGLDTSAALPIFFSAVPDVKKMFSIAEYHTFSANLTNEFRVAYHRANSNYPVGNFQFPGLDQFPNLTFDDIQLQLGPDPNLPQGSIQNVSQLTDNLSKTWGRHTFKFGYDIRDSISSSTFVQRARGDYHYSTLDLYLRDIMPDVTAERTVGTDGGVPLGNLQNSWFANDEFRLRPNLTLTLGLRYEYVTIPIDSRAQRLEAPASIPGVIEFREPQPGKNDWSPRLGVAWSPGKAGVWSIRAGFGRAMDNSYTNLNLNAKPALYATTKDGNIGDNSPNFLAGGGETTALPPPVTPAAMRSLISYYTPDGVRPYSVNYNLSVQRLLGKDYTLEARYLGSRGVHLYIQTQLNRNSLVSPAHSLPTFTSMPSVAALAALSLTLGDLKSVSNNPWAQYGFVGTMTSYAPIGNSSYNGLALQMTKRYSHNFSYLAAYTWSHAIDDSTATLNTTTLSPRRPQDFGNVRADRSNSAIDRRHRLTLTPSYDWKAFEKRSWILKNLVGNWNISATYTFETPEFATIQSNVDANLNGDNLDRAIVNTAGSGWTSSGVIAYDRTGAPVASDVAGIVGANGKAVPAISSAPATTVAYVAVNGRAHYIKAGPGAYPNAGRNTEPLSGINNIDCSLTKRIAFKERYRLELSGQFYNVLNHSQYFPGYISDSAGRPVLSSRNFLIPGNANFGRWDQYFSNNARTAQVVARFVF